MYDFEAIISHEGALAALRRKHNDAVAEMGEQLEQLTKTKAKQEKEATDILREMEDLRGQVA